MNFLGLSNQNMSTRPEVARSRQYFTARAPGDTSWTCPATGYYTFTYRGGGGFNISGVGASAAAGQFTDLIFSGQVVTFTIGTGSSVSLATGVATTVTLPSGKVVTAGPGNGITPGTASGGDLNISGSVSGIAPAIGNFTAVAAPTASSQNTFGPGVGGGLTGGGPAYAPGGSGILYIQAGKP